MARRKNAPDLVKVKCSVADRFRELRTELYGARGGPELARKIRTSGSNLVQLRRRSDCPGRNRASAY